MIFVLQMSSKTIFLSIYSILLSILFAVIQSSEKHSFIYKRAKEKGK